MHIFLYMFLFTQKLNLQFASESELLITQSFSRLETEVWRCGNSRESRNTSWRTVFHLETWTEPRPQSTWVSLERTDPLEKAFPTELRDRRKQSDNKNGSSFKIQYKGFVIESKIVRFFKSQPLMAHRRPIRYIFVSSFTISWSQNEFHSVLHWFEDLAHLQHWCVANLVGVLVPEQLKT